MCRIESRPVVAFLRSSSHFTGVDELLESQSFSKGRIMTLPLAKLFTFLWCPKVRLLKLLRDQAGSE